VGSPRELDAQSNCEEILEPLFQLPTANKFAGPQQEAASANRGPVGAERTVGRSARALSTLFAFGPQYRYEHLLVNELRLEMTRDHQDDAISASRGRFRNSESNLIFTLLENVSQSARIGVNAVKHQFQDVRAVQVDPKRGHNRVRLRGGRLDSINSGE